LNLRARASRLHFTLLEILLTVSIRDIIIFLLFLLSFFLVRPVAQEESKSEKHLKNIRQLTFGGENAEAYFSFDGKKLIFQSTRGEWPCDQIYIMNSDGSDVHQVSTGKGRTTCSYFLRDGKHFIYSSTHLGGEACPPKPDYSRGYVWSLEKDYDIFLSDLSGKLRRLTTTPGYDAEATISPDGKRIVFTSVRDGDLELYSMKTDGTDVLRLTRTPGYDGGAFFSPDNKKIVYRAHHPADQKALAHYKELLAQNLIEPRELELFVMDADGSHSTQITSIHAATFCPFFHPSGKKIIFSSNVHDPKGRNFDLFLIDLDGSGLEQITFNETFDGFPMFSPDGQKLVFASNRNGKVRGETNVFIADWVE
jgi:TolB protein